MCVCVHLHKYADSYKFIQDPDPEYDPDPGSDLKLSEKSDPDPGSDPKKIIPDPQHWYRVAPNFEPKLRNNQKLSVLWIRIRIGMDPHHFGDLDQHKIKIWIRIRIKVISWIRIRVSLQMTSQNVWNKSLF
jgi:hypothetical protein